VCHPCPVPYFMIVISELSDSSPFSSDIDYRHFDSADIEPRYEFGFGLSYTTFAYSGLSIETLLDLKNIPTGKTQPGGKSGLWTDAVSVTFTVKNTGTYSGNEVAQLYLVRRYNVLFIIKNLSLIWYFGIELPEIGQGAPSYTQRIQASVHSDR